MLLYRAAKVDKILREYPCSKPMAWRAECGLHLSRSISYPKGQVNIWHLYNEGFPAGGAEELFKLAAKGISIKQESQTTAKRSASSSKSEKMAPSKRSRRSKSESSVKVKVKVEPLDTGSIHNKRIECILAEARNIAPIGDKKWHLVEALNHLLKQKEWLPVIAKIGIPARLSRTKTSTKIVQDPFPALVKTIIYQQLAGKAASTILVRF